MMGEILIRQSVPGDRRAIESLSREAFPEEDLVPLVASLLWGEAETLALVAEFRDQLAGYVIFTICGVDGRFGTVALLGPLAVMPGLQRQGLGSKLVLAGVQRLAQNGIEQAFVLGDPSYYQRFGFAAESRVLPPYTLPAEWAEAWQSKTLDSDATPLAGQLSVPGPWRQPALWAPSPQDR